MDKEKEMDRKTMTRIGWVLGALIVLGLVGAAAFWAGTTYGSGWVGMMPRMMAPDVQSLPDGAQVMPYGMQGMWQRGHGGMPMAWGGGWSFGPLGLIFGGLRLLFFIGLLFLGFALLRRLFFGWGHGPWRGMGPEGFEARARERFEAWHKEAHGETATPPAN
jgi:hypothetical protein